jgi:hypothetical protein
MIDVSASKLTNNAEELKLGLESEYFFSKQPSPSSSF